MIYPNNVDTQSALCQKIWYIKLQMTGKLASFVRIIWSFVSIPLNEQNHSVNWVRKSICQSRMQQHKKITILGRMIFYKQKTISYLTLRNDTHFWVMKSQTFSTAACNIISFLGLFSSFYTLFVSFLCRARSHDVCCT